jgi:hypothetical protein
MVTEKTAAAPSSETTESTTSFNTMRDLLPGGHLLPKKEAPAAAPAQQQEKPKEPTEGEAKPEGERQDGAGDGDDHGNQEEAGTTGGEGDEATTTEEEEDPENEEQQGQVSDHVQKRIDKLTAKRKEAEEKATAAETKATEAERKHSEALQRIAQLEAAVQAKPQSIPQGTASDPLAGVETPQQLEAKVQEAMALKRWAIRNPDGGVLKNADGSEVEVSADQAREALAIADEVLTIHAPRRQGHLAEVARQSEEARKVYPDLFDTTKPDGMAVANFTQMLPQIKNFTDWHMVIGDYLAGKKAREAQATAAASTKPAAAAQPPKKTPPLAPSVPKRNSPAMASTAQSKKQSMESVVKAGGSADALLAMMRS